MIHLGTVSEAIRRHVGPIVLAGVVLGTAFLLPSGGEASVFCAKRKVACYGDCFTIAEGAAIKIRSTDCRSKEIQLPISFEDGGKTVRFTGVNVQIVSGSGGTGAPENGLGNLIVGYNEPGGADCDPDGCIARLRTGSHNIVVGAEHAYSSFGAIIGGYHNTVAGSSASVLAGVANSAYAPNSFIGAGYQNRTGGNGNSAAVVGGYSNTAVEGNAAVLGGDNNVAAGGGSTVCGGVQNQANALESSVVGGSGVIEGVSQQTASGFTSVSILEIRGH